MSVALKAYRSVMMCLNAPSTLRLERLALESTQPAGMVTGDASPAEIPALSCGIDGHAVQAPFEHVMV